MRDMQDKVHGVPVRHQKVFLTSIPFAFMGKLLLKLKLVALTKKKEWVLRPLFSSSTTLQATTSLSGSWTG